jgi:hypothetical protein
MKKALMLLALFVVMALPSTASASEPAEWYAGDLSAKQLEEGFYLGESWGNAPPFKATVVGGSYHVTQPSLSWDITCHVKGGVVWESKAFFTESLCSTANSCENFYGAFGSKETPLVPYKEGSIKGANTTDAYARFIFGPSCWPYPSEAVPTNWPESLPLHATYNNETEKLKFTNNYIGYSIALSGELELEGVGDFYGYQYPEEEEWGAMEGTPPISIR